LICCYIFHTCSTASMQHHPMRRSEEEEAAPTIGRLEYTALIQLARMSSLLMSACFRKHKQPPARTLVVSSLYPTKSTPVGKACSWWIKGSRVFPHDPASSESWFKVGASWSLPRTSLSCVPAKNPILF
jgi:hypothetical protein